MLTTITAIRTETKNIETVPDIPVPGRKPIWTRQKPAMLVLDTGRNEMYSEWVLAYISHCCV